MLVFLFYIKYYVSIYEIIFKITIMAPTPEIKEIKASPKIQTKLDKLLEETEWNKKEAKIYYESLSIWKRNSLKEELDEKEKSNWEKELTYDEIVEILKEKNRKEMSKPLSESIEQTSERAKKKAKEEKDKYVKSVEKDVNLKIEEKLWWWMIAWFAVTVMWWFWLWAKDLISNYENNSEKPWIFDGIKKTISEKILNWLWIEGVDEKLEKLNKDIENTWNKMGEWIDYVKNKVWSKVELVKNEEDESTLRVQKKVEKKENIETKKSRYYKFWRLFVKKLWYEKFTPKDNFGIITDNLKNKKYYELKDYTFKEYKKEFNSNITEKEFHKVKENILWNDMIIFFSTTIEKNKIEKLSKIEKFNDIFLDMWIDKNNIDFKKLSLENIFILFSLIIYNEFIIWTKSIPLIWKNIFDNFLEIKEDFPWYKEIERDFEQLEKQYEKDIMPKKLTKKLFKIDNWSENWSYNWNIKNNIFKDINDENKKYLEKLFKFKDNFDEKIINNKKYTFTNETKEKLKKQITFRDILSLYLSTKWEINESDWVFNFKIRWLFTILSRRNDEELKYWVQLNKYIKKLNNDDEKKKELFSQLIIEKIIEKVFYSPIIENSKKIWNGVIEIAKNNKVATWMWILLLWLVWKTVWKSIMKLKTLLYIWWFSALVYWYFQLKNNWLESEKLKEIEKWLITVWVNKEIFNKINSWEYKNQSDYNKFIENKFEKINDKELKTNLWNFSIEWNEIFFTGKKNFKFKLHFGNDIHSLSNTLWFDFWKEISKWVFKIDSVNFVKKWNNFYININNDYFLDLNTLQKNWDKYIISIWETIQENILDDINSAKDLILDWFYFEKINKKSLVN